MMFNGKLRYNEFRMCSQENWVILNTDNRSVGTAT